MNMVNQDPQASKEITLSTFFYYRGKPPTASKDSLVGVLFKSTLSYLERSANFLAYANWTDVYALLKRHHKIVWLAYISIALLGTAYNLLGVFQTFQVTSVAAVNTAQAVQVPLAAQSGNAQDQNFYPHPHIRVEHGEPRTRRLDYSASAYINQVAGGAFGRYLTIATPGQSFGDGNFIRSLDEMYSRKYASHGMDAKAEELRAKNYDTYRSTRVYMTLGQYIRGFDQVIDESVSAIDFQALCQDKWLRLDAVRCAALKRIASNVDARMMVSYQMTEMFDKSTPGDTNAWVLDQMYRYQGREAVDAVPAQSGKIPVVGGFQITEQLVGYDGLQPRSITLIASHSRLGVPETIFEFKRTDHERAAFYSVIYNFGRLLKSVDTDGVKILEEASITKKSDVVALMAASHRGSGDAREFAIRWLYDGISNPIEVYMYTIGGRNYPEYATSARRNYVGLDKYIRENF